MADRSAPAALAPLAGHATGPSADGIAAAPHASAAGLAGVPRGTSRSRPCAAGGSTRSCCSASLAVGALAGIKIKYAVLAVIAIGLIGWVMARPAVAAYLLIFLTPLIVGLNAGSVVPAAPAERSAHRPVRRGHRAALAGGTAQRRHPAAAAWTASTSTLIALGVTSSVLPLAMMAVRQRPITADDLLYCIVMWKLLAEYVIVRSVVSTREQAMSCLVLSMAAAAIVGVIGIMQSLGLAGVPGLLAKYTSSPGADGW